MRLLDTVDGEPIQAITAQANPTEPAAQRGEGGRFLPGNTANPTGRPKGANEFRLYMKGRTRENIDAIQRIAEDDKHPERLKALVWLVEQVIGKPNQGISVDEGVPLRVDAEVLVLLRKLVQP